MHVWYARLGVGLLPSKFLTEAALFVASYQIQKRFVFARFEVASAVVEPAPAVAARAVESTSAV